MAKSTLIFIFFLAVLATLLLGINIGKRIEKNQFASSTPIFSPTETLSPSPTTTLSPSPIVSPSPTIVDIFSGESLGVTTYRNQTCGFEFSYPGSYINQQTINEKSVILTDPNNPNEAIATTCAQKLPRPPVASDKIEAITIDGLAANLYHDQDAEGNPRDEIIVKHPTNGLEIIIAGYGPTFENVLSSFRFL